MTLEQIYNKVRLHLLTQNAKSLSPEAYPYVCAYRGVEGTMCAAGCLIPDEVYSPDIEGSNWSAACQFLRDKLPEYLLEKKTVDFVRRLQLIHDTQPVSEWKKHLDEFAKIHNLATVEFLE